MSLSYPSGSHLDLGRHRNAQRAAIALLGAIVPGPGPGAGRQVASPQPTVNASTQGWGQAALHEQSQSCAD